MAEREPRVGHYLTQSTIIAASPAPVPGDGAASNSRAARFL